MAKKKSKQLIDWAFPSTNDGAYAIINAGSLIPFKERKRGTENGKSKR